MAKKTQRTIVGSPLTPTLLNELSAIRDFPASPENFRPDGNWVNIYRIWTCHGYRESGNENVGFLRITRIGDSDKTFTLKIHQEVAQTDGITNIIDSTIKCRNNQLGSPIQWRVSIRFIDPDGKPLSQLSGNETGSAAVGLNASSCDWCLFEAVQRLEFNRQTSLNFDMLEGLSLLKKDQHLSYRGLFPTKIGAEKIPLRCFVQLGRGILPCEYWLNEQHRLLLVTSMNKAYIFDEKAEIITKQIIEEARKSYEKRKSSQRK